MIVWGGEGEPGYWADGAAYEPETDTWSPISSSGAPAARNFHSAVWTGREMIVMGGHDASGPFRNGGRYDPATDRWAAIEIPAPAGFIAPNQAAWTGSKVLIWSWAGPAGWGGLFEPESNTWERMARVPSSFEGRVPDVLVWTGTKMLVWGGQSGDQFAFRYGDGALFTP